MNFHSPPRRVLTRYFRTHLFLAILLGAVARLGAHQGAPPHSLQQKAMPVAAVRKHVLAPTEVQAELAADAKFGRGQPLRFAVPQKVDLTPATSGTWEQLPDGRLWRLRIVSTNATDINLGFSTFWLPQGATLHILAESENYYQGPYTAEDNSPQGQLWTPVVPGPAADIELFVPAQATEEPRLVLSQVGTGYRDFFHKQKDLPPVVPEGTCNNDVVCPVAIPWTNEIRSVGVYTCEGSWTCSGTLIADAAGDFRPYFLTANHCKVTSANAASVVVYWNYQSATCGTHGPGSRAQNQTGATFRAAKYDVDFCLLELFKVPDTSFNVFYSGWDRSGTAPAGCVGIHHPQCDVKAISFCTTPLTTANDAYTGGINTHWYVHWSSGVTEPGSSGSGIWDSTSQQLVGTLTDGNSACGGFDLTDYYGKLSVGWASGSSPADRLLDWLDPLNTAMSKPGGDPSVPAASVMLVASTLTAEGCTPTNGVVDPGESVSVSFTLQNTGTAPTANLVATLLAGNGVTAPSGPQSYGAVAAGGAVAARSFTFTANGACGGTITPVLQLQDGSKNLGTAAVSMTLGVLGSPATASYSSGGVAVTIPDLTTVEVPISVTDVGTVADVKARVRLNHTYDSDLVISLVHPDGTVIALASYRGGSGHNYGSGATDCSGTFTVFDDAASTAISSGTAPFAGSYRPETLLSTLNGKPVIGTWKLRVADTAAGDTGTNYCFQLDINRQNYICCTPCLLIVSPRRILPGSVAFSYDSISGNTYVVEAKTNVIATNWTALKTNAGDGSRQSFTNSATGASRSFFRVRTQ